MSISLSSAPPLLAASTLRCHLLVYLFSLSLNQRCAMPPRRTASICPGGVGYRYTRAAWRVDWTERDFPLGSGLAKSAISPRSRSQQVVACLLCSAMAKGLFQEVIWVPPAPVDTRTWFKLSANLMGNCPRVHPTDRVHSEVIEYLVLLSVPGGKAGSEYPALSAGHMKRYDVRCRNKNHGR